MLFFFSASMAMRPLLVRSVTCAKSEQQHVVILVRNEGQLSQLDQGNMW